LIESLQAAVAARPGDLPLRVHLAQLLLDAGRQADAVSQAAQVLADDPQNESARRLMSAAITGADRAPAGAEVDPAPARSEVGPAPAGSEVDWLAMEDELADVLPPRFVRAGDTADPVAGVSDRMFDVETSSIRLADVGGMDDVKRRLELAFLGPLRNPQLRALFGRSLRGGLLLYGPPGCGWVPR
jgi:SpoVK/Ycf46/Vps4 family AAA+-type ATPase